MSERAGDDPIGEVATATGVDRSTAAFALGYCNNDVTAAIAAIWSTDD